MKWIVRLFVLHRLTPFPHHLKRQISRVYQICNAFFGSSSLYGSIDSIFHRDLQCVFCSFWGGGLVGATALALVVRCQYRRRHHFIFLLSFGSILPSIWAIIHKVAAGNTHFFFDFHSNWCVQSPASCENAKRSNPSFALIS
eukprot:229718_1